MYFSWFSRMVLSIAVSNGREQKELFTTMVVERPTKLNKQNLRCTRIAFIAQTDIPISVSFHQYVISDLPLTWIVFMASGESWSPLVSFISLQPLVRKVLTCFEKGVFSWRNVLWTLELDRTCWIDSIFLSSELYPSSVVVAVDLKWLY